MEVFRLSPYLTQRNSVFAGSTTNTLANDWRAGVDDGHPGVTDWPSPQLQLDGRHPVNHPSVDPPDASAWRLQVAKCLTQRTLVHSTLDECRKCPDGVTGDDPRLFLVPPTSGMAVAPPVVLASQEKGERVRAARAWPEPSCWRAEMRWSDISTDLVRACAREEAQAAANSLVRGHPPDWRARPD